MAMRRDKVEQRLARIERLANEQLDVVAQLRSELGRGESADQMWARMIFQVLSHVAKRGGSIPREEVLEVAEGAGYSRRGVAGLYQRLLRLEGGTTYLTEEGKKRLARLKAQIGGAK